MADWIWEWSGEALSKSTNRRTYYEKVKRIDPEENLPTRTFCVGDSLAIRGEDDQKWVGHLLELFHVTENDDIIKDDDLSSTSTSKTYLMRITVRWYYSLPDVPPNAIEYLSTTLQDELYACDYVENDGFLSVDVIIGRAWLFPSQSALKQFISSATNFDTSYDICRIVRYYVNDTQDTTNRHPIKKQPARKLAKGELDYLLSNPSKARDMYVTSYKLFNSKSNSTANTSDRKKGQTAATSRRRKSMIDATKSSNHQAKDVNGNPTNSTARRRRLRRASEPATQDIARENPFVVDDDDDQDDGDFIDNITDDSKVKQKSPKLNRKMAKSKEEDEDEDFIFKKNGESEGSNDADSDSSDSDNSDGSSLDEKDTIRKRGYTNTGRRIVRFTKEERENGSDNDDDGTEIVRQEPVVLNRRRSGSSMPSMKTKRSPSKTRRRYSAHAKNNKGSKIRGLSSSSGPTSLNQSNTSRNEETLDEVGTEVLDFITELNNEADNVADKNIDYGTNLGPSINNSHVNSEAKNVKKKKKTRPPARVSGGSSASRPSRPGESFTAKLRTGVGKNNKSRKSFGTITIDDDDDDDDDFTTAKIKNVSTTKNKDSAGVPGEVRGSEARQFQSNKNTNLANADITNHLNESTPIQTAVDNEGDIPISAFTDKTILKNESSSITNSVKAPDGSKSNDNKTNILGKENQNALEAQKSADSAHNNREAENSTEKEAADQAKKTAMSVVNNARPVIRGGNVKVGGVFMPTEKESVVGMKIATLKAEQERKKREAEAATRVAAEKRMQEEKNKAEQLGLEHERQMEMLLNGEGWEEDEELTNKNLEAQLEGLKLAFFNLTTAEKRAVVGHTTDIIDVCTRRVDAEMMRGGGPIDSDIEDQIALELVDRIRNN